MRGMNTYKQTQKVGKPRIDVILFLYRKALAHLDDAKLLLERRQAEGVRPLLTKVQLIVNGLGAGLPGEADSTADNFRRLYEFVSFKLDGGSLDDIAAARQVLNILLEAFETVRDQAVTLESQGHIPPLDDEHHIHLTI